MTGPNHTVLLFTGIPAWLSSTSMQTNHPHPALINNSQPGFKSGTVKLLFSDLQHLFGYSHVSCMQMSSHLWKSHHIKHKLSCWWSQCPYLAPDLMKTNVWFGQVPKVFCGYTPTRDNIFRTSQKVKGRCTWACLSFPVFLVISVNYFVEIHHGGGVDFHTNMVAFQIYCMVTPCP